MDIFPNAPLLDAKGNALPDNWLARIAVIWTGQAASILATCAASFAAIWYITETTSSAVWLSLAAASSLLPVALLSPFGGVAADQFNRKRIMIAADGTASVFSLAMALAALGGALSAPFMLVILAVRSCAQAFHGPALSAVMPRLVPAEHLIRINTMDQALTSLSAIVGPALGILMYNFLGFHGVMLFDAACGALACICLAAAHIPAHDATNVGNAGVMADLREGALFVWRDKGLRSLMLLMTATMLLFMPVSSLSPLMTYEFFRGDGYAASLIEAAFGMGMLIGSIVAFVWGGKRKSVPFIMASGVIIGIGLSACGLLQPNQFPLFAVFIVVVAIAIGCLNAPVLPLMQKRTPEEKMGRVMGIFLMGSSLAAPVGLSFSGFIAEYIGITNWFLTCGALIALTFALTSRSKSIKELDS